MSETKETAVKGQWDNGIYRFPLRKKIPAHGEEIEILEIREPTGEDVINYGVIVSINNDNTLSFDTKRVGPLLSHLASIPTSSIGKMSPNDLISLIWIIAPFFLPG